MAAFVADYQEIFKEAAAQSNSKIENKNNLEPPDYFKSNSAIYINSVSQYIPVKTDK